jgi:hypothetical protein
MDVYDSAIKTYRYLRVGMVLLVVTLGVSVGVEVAKVGGHCWQTSISAYYYTPAQAIFVGALIAIGVSMIALKGNTEWEDLFLNIAGMLAPVVALVPTPYPGDNCFSVPVTPDQQHANIANNLAAALAVALIGYAVTALLSADAARRGKWQRKQTVAMVFVALVIAVALVVFLTHRSFFEANAHYAAAIVMFGFITLVVAWNAWATKQDKPWLSALYAAVAVLMVGSTVILYVVMKATGWAHGVLWIEAILIGCFATFWIMQTADLWRPGLRGARTIDSSADQATHPRLDIAD